MNFWCTFDIIRLFLKGFHKPEKLSFEVKARPRVSSLIHRWFIMISCWEINSRKKNSFVSIIVCISYSLPVERLTANQKARLGVQPCCVSPLLSPGRTSVSGQGGRVCGGRQTMKTLIATLGSVPDTAWRPAAQSPLTRSPRLLSDETVSPGNTWTRTRKRETDLWWWLFFFFLLSQKGHILLSVKTNHGLKRLRWRWALSL